ncbi:MAG: hypothetical protein KDI29_05260, partial [Pseudomonadales bacterium]|nr:hypothetical protein [Pseudomonadales bacterium]
MSRVAADDFASLGQQIQDQQSLVQSLQSRYDRVDYRLLEPLLGLARSQTRANRFDDAHDSLSQAVQVVRISNGL